MDQWTRPIMETSMILAWLKIDEKSDVPVYRQIVDGVLPEPVGGAHRDPAAAIATLQKALIQNLDELSGVSGTELVRRRAARYRRLGVWSEPRG